MKEATIEQMQDIHDRLMKTYQTLYPEDCKPVSFWSCLFPSPYLHIPSFGQSSMQQQIIYLRQGIAALKQGLRAPNLARLTFEEYYKEPTS